MSYYSIDDIETDGIRVPTKFLIDVPGLGFLLPDRMKRGGPADMYAGAEVMLPLWLAAPLASAVAETRSDGSGGDVPILEMQEPTALNQDVLNVLKSEPGALDLRSQSRLFTYLALAWNDLFTGDELARVLYDAIRIRAAEIFDSALAQNGVDQSLDDYEVALYNSTANTIKDLQKWSKK